MTAADVLVVEDEDGVRTTVAAILRMQGYRVDEAVDGEEALTMLGHEAPAVLVLDYHMPRLDGLALLDALAHPPVTILMSAHSIDPDTHRRVGTKVFRLLKKPFNPDRLLSVVADALSQGTVGQGAVEVP